MKEAAAQNEAKRKGDQADTILQRMQVLHRHLLACRVLLGPHDQYTRTQLVPIWGAVVPA